MTKPLLITAITKKNQGLVNKTVRALIAYNKLNSERDKASDADNDKLVQKLNRKCENAFDKYLGFLNELPKNQQKIIDNTDLYKIG